MIFTAILTKLPWIGSLLGFFKTKKRLVIEYILIALLVATAAFTFTMWLQKLEVEKSLAETRTDLVTVQNRVTVVESVNSELEQTVGNLKELRLEDAKALGGLLRDYKALADRDLQVRRRLSTLEQTNETVREYLNQPLPPELVCMLNNTCEAGTGDTNRSKNRTSNPAAGTRSSVPPAQTPGNSADKRPH